MNLVYVEVVENIKNAVAYKTTITLWFMESSRIKLLWNMYKHLTMI